LLAGKGSMSNARMEEYVDKVYERFNGQRKIYELQQADAEDVNELKQLEASIKKRNSKK
jgi:hypothetical protein